MYTEKDITSFIDSKKNEDFYSLGEAQVQQSIILPLLSHLGWNVARVKDEVIPQFKIGKGKVDYGLKIEDECKVIIEAKRGKEDLINIDNEMQIISYASGINVPLAVLTNGKSWQFYLPLLGGGTEKKRFYAIDMSESDPSNVASKLTGLLSKENIRKIDTNNFEELIYDKYRRPIKAAVKDVKQIKAVKSEKNYIQDYLSVDNDFTGIPIYSFYFNGITYQTEKWKDLLTGILDIMYSTHRKDFGKVLGVTGRQGRVYFSQNPDEVNNPLEIRDTEIYVDTKLGSNNIVRLCCDIIYEFGYSDDDLKIKTSKSNTEIEKEDISRPTTMITKSTYDDTGKQQDVMTTQPVDDDSSEKDKKEKYGKYASAIRKLLPTIKKWIEEAKDGIIRVKAEDLAKDMGGDFSKKNPTSIYWGLKYVLFKEGIIVDTGANKSGDKLLTMRFRAKGDKLPPSLQKYLDEDDEEKYGVQSEQLEKINGTKKKLSSSEFRNMLEDLPSSLGNTLEVYYYTLDGLMRSEATNLVAKRKDVTPSTISSSYTRSLDKSTSEIDILMQPENGNKLKKFLIVQFPEHIDEINEFFSNI